MTNRVLVAEDDTTVAEVVTLYLQGDGHEVEWVADGVTALHRVGVISPDVVVLDIMLPGLDGFEVCRRIRERSPVPVVMLTALGEETDRVLGLREPVPGTGPVILKRTRRAAQQPGRQRPPTGNAAGHRVARAAGGRRTGSR